MAKVISRSVIIVSCLMILVMLLGFATSIGSVLAQNQSDTVEIIIKFKASATSEDMDVATRDSGGVVLRDIPQLRTRVIQVPASDGEQVLAALVQNPSVQRAAMAVRVTSAGTPNDSEYREQWALPKIAWDQVYGTVAISGSATIAVLDTGVDATHPDLAGVMAAGQSFVGGDANTDPNGHGTALAGICAASVNNAIGTAGVAYSGVTISSVQVLHGDGTGLDSDVLAGVVWAVDNGARVLLIGLSSLDYSDALADALQYAWENGVVIVAATGNDGSSAASYPAGMPNVLGVAATDQNDAVVASSNTGSACVAAPGVDIYTTLPGGSYGSISGTSAAAAHTAGLAALLVANGQSNEYIYNQIRGATDPVEGYTFGRINMAKAMGEVSISPPNPPEPSPTPAPEPPVYIAAAVGDFASRAAGNWNAPATWFKYLTGTVAFTNLSTAVTGTGTLFTTELATGDVLMLQASPATVRGTVASITDNTHLTLVANATQTMPTAAYGKQAVPSSADGVITITHAVTVTADVTVDQVVNSAAFKVSSGATLTVANGTGTDFATGSTVACTIDGTLNVDGQMSGFKDFTISSTGIVNVSTGSTLTVNQGGAPTLTVNGTLSVASTGTVTGLEVITIGNGGTATVSGTMNLSDGNGDLEVNAGGNLNITGGSISVSSVATVNVNGTITMSGASTLSVFRGNGGPLIVVNSPGQISMSDTALITSTTSAATADVVTLNSGSTLIMGPSAIIGGNGEFFLNSGASMSIGSTAGITSTGSGATENIRVSSTRSYDIGANYTYHGTAAQVTGNGLPATVNNLTINNANGVTLSVVLATTSGSRTVNGVLALTSGDLMTGAYTLTMGTTATTTGDYDVVGTVKRTSPAAGAKTYGSAYTSLNFGSAVTGDVTVILAKTAPSGFTKYANRVYTLTKPDAGSAAVRLHYRFPGDLVGSPVESALGLWRYDAGSWALQGRDDGATGSGASWVQKNDVATFSNWAIAVSNNTAPVANAQLVTTCEGTAKAITLSGSDPETVELTFSIVIGPSHGSLGVITDNAGTSGTPNTDTANVTYTPTANGSDSFTYKVNDGSLDSASATVSITINALPTVEAGDTQYVCYGGSSFALTATTPATGGTWTGTGVSGSDFNPAGLTAGDYTVTYTYTDGNGCINSDTKTVTIRALPTVDAGDTQYVCEGGSAITLTGGTPGGGTWSGTGVSDPNFDPDALAPGDYTVTYTYTDTGGTGCANSADKTVTIMPDSDRDGIPDSEDCTPLLKTDVVVDPLNVVPPTFTGIKVNTLQAAVNAAADDNVINMYADTKENVVIGATTGSGGKDLRIIGCGHKVTASDTTKPVIRVESTAGAIDGNTGKGERDIHIEDLDVRGGSIGYVVETTGSPGTSTLLKSVRSASNGIGIKVSGNGNEVRGSNGVNSNTGFGIQVNGKNNLITDNRVNSNGSTGVDVTGNGNLVKKNKVVEDTATGSGGHGIAIHGDGNSVLENDAFGNKLDGINVAGSSNTINKNQAGEKGNKANVGDGIDVTGNTNTLEENDVFGNGGKGILVTGNSNTLLKNDVGDSGNKGNGGQGISVAGSGNTLRENKAFSNGGDGINVSGGTASAPNVLSKNVAGDKGNKGNLGNGIVVGGTGNGKTSPVEIEENTAKSNKLDGIKVSGSGHQLKNNTSGGKNAYPAGEDNGDWEYELAVGNFDSGGNKANAVAVTLASPGTKGTP